MLPKPAVKQTASAAKAWQQAEVAQKRAWRRMVENRPEDSRLQARPLSIQGSSEAAAESPRQAAAQGSQRV